MLFAELVRERRLKLDRGICWILIFSMGSLCLAVSAGLTDNISTDKARLDLLAVPDDCKREARGRSGESGVGKVLKGEVSIMLAGSVVDGNLDR